MTGIVSASGLSLDATTLTLQATAKVAAAAVTLTAANGVIELGNPTLQTAELRVDAGVGSAMLAGTGNQLAGLGTSSAAGDVTVVNAAAGLLTVDGSVHAGAGQSIRLVTDQLAVTGGLAAPGGTVAIAPYTPTRALTLDASRATGSLSLVQADLANIATGAGTIVLGSVDGGATRAASLAIDAPMIFANTLALQLFAHGGVTASGSGGVSVSHLGAVAGSGGLLLGTANAVDRIDALTATGPIVFGDTKDLTVAGPVAAGLLAAGGQAGFDGTIRLSSTGAVTLNGDVLALARQVSGVAPGSLTGITIDAATTLTQSGGTVATDAGIGLNAGAGLTQGAGLVTAGGALVATAGGALLQSGGTMSAFGTIGLTGASVTQSGGLVGAGGALGVTATGGDVAQTGGVLAAAGAGATIGATGNVTQTGGAIYGDAITVSAGGVAGVGTLLGRPALVIPEGTPGLYPGSVTVAAGTPPPGTLVLKGAAVNVTTALTATTSIELDAAIAAVTESGAGSLATATLLGGAATAATLQGGNSVRTLAGFTVGVGSGFSLTNLTNLADLTIAGPVSAPGGLVTVRESGQLTLAGAITAGTQTLAASGMIQQTAGTITADRVSLQTTGVIGQTGGVLTAGTLDGGGVIAASLAQPTNEVGTLAGFATAGPFTLVDAGPLTITGPVASGGGIGIAAAALILDGAVSTPGGTLGLLTAGAIS